MMYMEEQALTRKYLQNSYYDQGPKTKLRRAFDEPEKQTKHTVGHGRGKPVEVSRVGAGTTLRVNKEGAAGTRDLSSEKNYNRAAVRDIPSGDGGRIIEKDHHFWCNVMWGLAST